MTEAGRVESFTYKSTKAPAQGLAGSVADIAGQYDAYREKRETERRDDVKAERAEETELMVLITPRLIRALNPDEVPPLPTSIRPFIKKGDIGQQLDGAGGVVDAPRNSKDAAPVARKEQ